MTEPSSPRRIARLAGAFYLVTVILGLFAELVVRGPLDYTNAALTAHQILAAETLYRLGFVADTLGGLSYLVVTWLLYELFKRVNQPVALLAALFSLVGIAIGGVTGALHLAPLFLLKGAPYLAPFTLSQLQALALLSLKLHSLGYQIALVFFGCYCVLLGYLIVTSSLIPNLVGALIAVAGFALLFNSFIAFVSPPLSHMVVNYFFALDGIGEIVLMLWLLIKGANDGGRLSGERA
jgi:Domain of unknown function (DUF4386)